MGEKHPDLDLQGLRLNLYWANMFTHRHTSRWREKVTKEGWGTPDKVSAATKWELGAMVLVGALGGIAGGDDAVLAQTAKALIEEEN